MCCSLTTMPLWWLACRCLLTVVMRLLWRQPGHLTLWASVA